MGEQRDISHAIAQGRHLDFDYRDAEIKVFAEGAFADHLLQIAVGGAEHSNIDGMRNVRTQALDRPLLQHAQQLGLQREGQVADLIDEDRAVVRFFKSSAAALVCAGECAAFVAEQFGVDQCVWERANRKSHKRFICARAQAVDGISNHLLARAAFTCDQHGGLHASDLVNHVVHAGHWLAVAQQPFHSSSGQDFLSGCKFTRHFRLAAGAIDGKTQLLNVQRLLQKIHSAIMEKLKREG